MQFADYILDNAPIGMVVYVHGGPTGENPQPFLDEPALPAPPPPVPVPVPIPEPIPFPEPVPVPEPLPAEPPADLLGNIFNP
jgi:hypothetical protein